MKEHLDNPTRYEKGFSKQLDKNQGELVDELTTPHVRLPETLGPKHAIVCSVPAYTPGTQPVQARGRIVWNKAYKFQPHGPSYLDPVPDPNVES